MAFSDQLNNKLRLALGTGAAQELEDEVEQLQDLDTADLAKIDGITNGTVAASKAVVVDTNKDVTGFRNVDATGTIKSSGATSGIGYATGAGGTVTQATNKSTGVTLNKVCGQITMNNAALAAGAEVAFTLTNSAIAATDVVAVSIASGGASASYGVAVTATAAGSCEITLANWSAGSLSEAVVLNFVVIKGVSA